VAHAAFPAAFHTVKLPSLVTVAAQKEVFAPRAFAYNLDEGVNIHLLVGHSYDKPLASTDTGALKLQDSEAALSQTTTILSKIRNCRLSKISISFEGKKNRFQGKRERLAAAPTLIAALQDHCRNGLRLVDESGDSRR
jgi:phage head maturation protease